MKNFKYPLYAIAAVLLAFGCQESSLQIKRGSVCIQQKSGGNCVETPPPARLHAPKGEAQLRTVDLPGQLGRISYPQFEAAQLLAEGQYSLQADSANITFSMGKESYSAPSNVGFLFEPGPDGQMFIRKGRKTTAATRYQYDPKGFLFTEDSRGDSIIFTGGHPVRGLIANTIVMMISQEIANRVIPSDTGTEVVLVDDFAPEFGDCEVEAPEGCCPPGEFAGEPRIDITPFISEFNVAGLDVMACFQPEAVCVFTHGNKLIVMICSSGERYCLDFSVCSLTVTVSSESGICISKPLECNMENPF